MPERIENPAQPPAMLLGHLGRRRSTSGNRLRCHRIRIADDEQGPPRRAANCLRAETGSLRPARGHPEGGVAHCQLRYEVTSLPDAMKDASAESRLVESDSLISTIDPQFRLNIRHAGRG